MSVTINGTTVRLQRDPEDWRKLQVLVRVASVKKPGLCADQTFDPGKAPTMSHFLKALGAAAALCAEYLGERYGDNLDPASCSRDVYAAFREEAKLLASMRQDAAQKIKRLRSSGWGQRAPAEDRAQLDRMKWLMDKGEQLTIAEGELINKWIGQLHGAQL